MLSESGEDVNENNDGTRNSFGNKVDKSSRIEVFRKTPSIIRLASGSRKNKASKMNSTNKEDESLALADDEQYF